MNAWLLIVEKGLTSRVATKIIFTNVNDEENDFFFRQHQKVCLIETLSTPGLINRETVEVRTRAKIVYLNDARICIHSSL